MRVLIIENYPKTTPGVVGRALEEAGAQCEIVRMHGGGALPRSHAGYEALVLLGGAQSALDDADHPYLPAEAQLGRSFGEAGKPVLGICLGAQLIARAYGARNILGRPIEFGWHAVRTTEAGHSDPMFSAIGAAAPLFHWHLDTFTLPPGATCLARSDMTEIQAFRIGATVYGVQFHFEADTGLVASWNRDFAEEIAPVVPDWMERYPEEVARHGKAADAAGLALARAWVKLIRPAESSNRKGAAKLAHPMSREQHP